MQQILCSKYYCPSGTAGFRRRGASEKEMLISGFGGAEGFRRRWKVATHLPGFEIMWMRAAFTQAK